MRVGVCYKTMWLAMLLAFTRSTLSELAVMSSAAKTVSFSPLRRGQQSIKNTLDSPFKLKWPDVPPQAASQIFLALEKSLSELKACFARSKQPKRKSRKRKALQKCDSESLEPPTKKQCKDNTQSGIDRNPDSTVSNSGTGPSTTTSNKLTESNAKTDNSSELADSHTSTNKLNSDKCASREDASSTLKSQVVIGVNNVTRCLERGELCAGLVCLSAKPALVTRHIMMLAATQKVPFAALPSVSEKIVALLGDIKSALAIGFKAGTGGQFTSLTETITELAPSIVLPCLPVLETAEEATVAEKSSKGHSGSQEVDIAQETTEGTSQYVPVQIKKTILTVKRGK